jgi:hypothetical protein
MNGGGGAGSHVYQHIGSVGNDIMKDGLPMEQVGQSCSAFQPSEYVCMMVLNSALAREAESREPRGGSSCFKTCLILKILFNKTNTYEWIFQFYSLPLDP